MLYYIQLKKCENLFRTEKLLTLCNIFQWQGLENWGLAKIHKIHNIFSRYTEKFFFTIEFLNNVFSFSCLQLVSSFISVLKEQTRKKICWGFLHVHCAHLLTIFSKEFGGILPISLKCFSVDDINSNCSTQFKCFMFLLRIIIRY